MRGRLLVSAFIVIAMGLQAATAFGYKFKRLWPFICYPMYSFAHPESEPVERHTIIGTKLDDQEIELTAEKFGLDDPIFQMGPVKALRKKRFSELEPYLDRLTRRTGISVRKVRLINQPLLIVGEGTVDLPEVVISEYEMVPVK